MAKKFFEAIDSTLFTQIDRFKKAPEYVKFQENFNIMNENVQGLIKILSLVFVAFLPLSLFLILYLGNLSMRNEVAVKNQVISLSNSILDKSTLTEAESKKILSRSIVDNQSALTKKLTSASQALGVDLAKFQISNFESSELSGNIIQATANIKFNSLSNDQLFGFIQNLVSTDRLK